MAWAGKLVKQRHSKLVPSITEEGASTSFFSEPKSLLSQVTIVPLFAALIKLTRHSMVQYQHWKK
jgi:hypothetical protein